MKKRLRLLAFAVGLLSAPAFAVTNYSYEFAPHDLSSTTSHAPYVVAESGHYATYPVNNLFDGHTDDFWIVQTTGTCYFQVYLGSGITRLLTSYWLEAQLSPDNNRAPSAWVMAGSNDGTNWTTLNTQTGQSFASGEKKVYTIASPGTVKYSYFRLTSSANGGNPTYTAEVHAGLTTTNPPPCVEA